MKISRGKFGEIIAKNYLEKNGYKVLFQNYKTRFGEIDIIAEEKDFIIFVEVKYRTNPNFGKAEESINNFKLEKIKKTAEHFIESFNKVTHKIRFDIIAINNFSHLEINHYKNIILEGDIQYDR